MKRITVNIVRDAYARMGYQPCRGEWRQEKEPREGGRDPVELACPQTTLLELAGLISHDEEGPNIETAADDEWGTAYANGFRDGWDGLESRTARDCTIYGPTGWEEYELGYADGAAAAAEIIEADPDEPPAVEVAAV
jgi:hypothetical protein